MMYHASAKRASPARFFYVGLSKWAHQAVIDFKQKMPDTANRVHVFTLKLPAERKSIMPVYPPLRLAEVRPILTQYGKGPDAAFELGAYMHFRDNRQDHWTEIYSSEKKRSRSR